MTNEQELESAAILHFRKYFNSPNEDVKGCHHMTLDCIVQFATSNDAAKQYHTKEARELIEELRNKLKKMSVRSFSPSLNEIFELATKAENFLNK